MENVTTFYLIRHSIKFEKDLIEEYRTNQSYLLKEEKIILSVEGEKRAKILSKQKELENIDKVYASNCVRTLQTAKYLLDKQNLKVTIDDRFDERRRGKKNDDKVPNWFTVQYIDENYKTEGGESQKEVRERFNEAFYEILNENRGKRIAIFAHAYAITFFLLQWMKLEKVTETREFKFSYNNKIILDRKIDAPEIFKLTIDENNNVKDISIIDVNYNI